MIEEERFTLRGDPDKEARAWAAEIAQIDLKRSGFQDMAAEGLITFDELRSKLAVLGETRKTAERELKVLSSRRQEIEALEQDANALLDSLCWADTGGPRPRREAQRLQDAPAES